MPPVDCLLVHTDGGREPVRWAQESVATRLGGPVTFVGSLDAVDVVVVALRDPDPAVHGVHAWQQSLPRVFFDRSDTVFGPVVCVATSADCGDEVDVDLPALHSLLDAMAAGQES